MKVASFYSIVGTIQCLIFSLFMESDLSAWKIQPNFDLYLIIATVIKSTFFLYQCISLGLNPSSDITITLEQDYMFN